MLAFKVFLLSMSLTVWSQTNTQIDASGSNGRDAVDGTSYSTRPGASPLSGADGGNAGPSSPGADGANINVNISSFNQNGESFIRIYGEVDSSGQFNRNIVLGAESQISLVSQGGDGGDGGVGGNGQGGCNGSRGRDATESSSGTDGGPGCDGGDAGQGSPGSDGGDGGDIRVFIPVEDIHLSLLVSCDVSAGQGGDPGAHGDPGSGGRGGSGGNSHSWQVQTGQSCPPPRTVDNGNGSFTTVQDPCTPIMTTMSNPGGSNGPDGSRGSIATGPLGAGSNGRDGTCLFSTEDGGRDYVGGQPFNLQVLSYEIYDENRDGIFEPLERLFINNIIIKNNGDLPSPSGSADFNLFFRSTNYTSPVPQVVTLPRVEPGANFRVSETFEFQVNDTRRVGENNRLSLQDHISPQNEITQINRAQPGFGNTRNFVVTYPIEVRAFTLQESVGPGEEIPVFWRIKNNSNRDFGGEEELRRVISQLSIVGGDADPSLFTFTGENGESSILSNANIMEILSLRANEEILIEGSIRISEEALAYTGIDLGQSLILENLMGELREIQRNSLTLRISQLYRHRPESEFLLITNSNTVREEFLAWQNLQRQLGASVDVWDFSYYGSLSFTRALEETSNRTLDGLLGNKTIILLNKSGSESRGAITLNEMARQLVNHQTNLIVVGGEESALRSQMFDLLSVPFSGERAVEETGLVETFWSWVSPQPEDFVAVTESNRQSLIAEDPTSRFFFRATFSPELVEDGFFRDSYRLGEITYTRTLTPGGGRAVFLPLTQREMQSASYVESEEVIRAVLLPTSFSYKLEELEASFDSVFRGYLKDALLYDLILEIDLKETECLHSDCDFDSGLTRLTSLLESVQQDSLQSEKIYIISALSLYFDELEARSLKRHLNNLTDSLSEHPLIREAVEAVREQAEERRKVLVGISKRDNYRNLFTYPAVFRALTTDQEINSRNAVRN